MQLNDAGRIVSEEWTALPGRCFGIDVDAFVVMPNHVHVILWINPVGALFMAPHDSGADNPNAINRAPTMGEIIRAFKTAVTRRLRQSELSEFAWQHNGYEYIIRSDASLARIREYIASYRQLPTFAFAVKARDPCLIASLCVLTRIHLRSVGHRAMIKQRIEENRVPQGIGGDRRNKYKRNTNGDDNGIRLDRDWPGTDRVAGDHLQQTRVLQDAV